MNDHDEYTQAWGEGAIVPPDEKTVQGEARKKASQDQADFEEEFANLVAQDDGQGFDPGLQGFDEE